MKTHRKTVWLLLVVYIFLLAYFTLMDNTFGRNIFNIKNLSYEAFVNYINNSVNLIPFATIKLYISGLKSNAISTGYFVVNILGNLLMLMPLSFFLPTLVCRINKFYKFFMIVIAASLLIEILQILFLTGSCDIDDVILNVSGAALAYPLFIKLDKVEQTKNK